MASSNSTQLWLLLAFSAAVAAASCAAAQTSYSQQAAGGYITAIEDQTTEQSGFFVATSDNNYAIYSPNLTSYNWLAVSVNGNDVFIILKDNSTIVTSLSRLSETARDFLSESKSNFTQNLIALNLVYSSGYSSASAGYSYGHETYRLSSASGAGRAIDQLAFPSRARSFLQANGNFVSAPSGPLRRLPYEPIARGPFSKHPAGQVAPLAAKRPSPPCLAPTNFNYYNLERSHELNDSLAGDVYHFDMLGNALDVYSTSVSVKQRCRSISLIYRDFRYFSYANRGLPLQIVRFFVLGGQVFFVYTDGTVLVKKSFMLDQIELDLVIDSRRLLKSITRWQVSSGGGGGSGAKLEQAAAQETLSGGGAESQAATPRPLQAADGAPLASTVSAAEADETARQAAAPPIDNSATTAAAAAPSQQPSGQQSDAAADKSDGQS